MRTRLFFALMLLAAVVAASPVFALPADYEIENVVVGGTIQPMTQLLISGAGNLATMLNLNHDAEGEAAYDAGFITSALNATVLTIDSNTAWKLTVMQAGAGWADLSIYAKDNDDLLIKITNGPTGTDANGFKAAFRPVKLLAGVETMLTDAANGVSNDIVHIQTKVMLDWVDDIPGLYSTTLVYTLATIP